MGLPLDGITRTEEKQSTESAEDPRIVDKVWAATDWTLAKALKTTKLWFFIVQSFVMGVGYNTILVHSVASIVDAGYSRMLAASIFAMMGGLSMVSALGGAISDRIGRELAFMLGSIGMCLAVLVLMLTRDMSSPWMLYVFAVLYGTCQGVDRPIIMAAKADVFQGKHLGVIMGFNNLGYGIGGALGAWLAGYIFDVSGSYTLAFTIAILSLVGASAFLWAAAPRKIKIVGGKVPRQQSYPQST